MKLLTTRHFIFLLVLSMSPQIFAQCSTSPILLIDSKFPETDNYQIWGKEEFEAQIIPNQNSINFVRILINGEEHTRFETSELIKRADGSSMSLETKIGPINSDARIEVPSGINFVSVEVVVDEDCSVIVDRPIWGAFSGIHAVVIGISEYFSSNDLKYANKDAEAFAELLQTSIDSEDHLRFELLQDEEANKRDIEIAIEAAAEELSSEGTLMVYFSGHGMIKARNQRSKIESYLVPYDGETSRVRSTMISHESILELISVSSAKNKVFILDSCFGGRGRFEEHDPFASQDKRGKFLPFDNNTKNAMRQSENWNQLNFQESVLWFSSSKRNELSFESDTYKHGLFTHYFKMALQDEAWRASLEEVKYSDIENYISEKIKAHDDGLQTPNNFGDDIVAHELISRHL